VLIIIYEELFVSTSHSLTVSQFSPSVPSVEVFGAAARISFALFFTYQSSSKIYSGIDSTLASKSKSSFFASFKNTETFCQAFNVISFVQLEFFTTTLQLST
jgi:hypothetical protein